MSSLVREVSIEKQGRERGKWRATMKPHDLNVMNSGSILCTSWSHKIILQYVELSKILGFCCIKLNTF